MIPLEISIPHMLPVNRPEPQSYQDWIKQMAKSKLPKADQIKRKKKNKAAKKARKQNRKK